MICRQTPIMCFSYYNKVYSCVTFVYILMHFASMYVYTCMYVYWANTFKLNYVSVKNTILLDKINYINISAIGLCCL